MENIELFKATEEVDKSFVGLKIRNNKIYFYYPESYNLSKKEDNYNFRNDVLAILNTISIAKTKSNNISKVQSSLSKDVEFALLSYLWMIQDYIKCGLYVNKEKVFKSNQRGRINWKRTFRNQPIISNGNVIYSDIIVEVKNPNDNILVDIHKYCIKKSVDIIGWLFGINKVDFQVKPFNKSIKNLYIKTLRNELESTFDDTKKIRLNHMLKVIQGIDGDAIDDEFIYGVDNYYYVYERMIDSIFGNQKNMKDFYPKANWYIASEGYKKYPSSNLRPDSILIKDDIAYILDSKYYRYGTTANVDDLPETTSVQKQITYAEYLKNNGKVNVKEIRNAFVMPYNCNNNKFESNEIINYVGFAKTEWKTNNDDYEHVYAFLVDTKHVIQNWNKNNHKDDIEKLVCMIEDTIKEEGKPC